MAQNHPNDHQFAEGLNHKGHIPEQYPDVARSGNYDGNVPSGEGNEPDQRIARTSYLGHRCRHLHGEYRFYEFLPLC